jgi:hypothetical protein
MPAPHQQAPSPGASGAAHLLRRVGAGRRLWGVRGGTRCQRLGQHEGRPRLLQELLLLLLLLLLKRLRRLQWLLLPRRGRAAAGAEAEACGRGATEGRR